MYSGYELWRLRLSSFSVTDWRLRRWRLWFLALMTATLHISLKIVKVYLTWAKIIEICSFFTAESCVFVFFGQWIWLCCCSSERGNCGGGGVSGGGRKRGGEITCLPAAHSWSNLERYVPVGEPIRGELGYFLRG